MKKRQDPLGKESANGGRLLRRLLGRANLFHTPPPVPANRQISCANRRRRLFSSFSLMSQPHLRMISLPLVTRPPFGAGGGAVPAPRQRASAPRLLGRAARAANRRVLHLPLLRACRPGAVTRATLSPGPGPTRTASAGVGAKDEGRCRTRPLATRRRLRRRG